MLLDMQNKFSDGQAVTATAVSTNVIDTLPVKTPNLTSTIGNGAGDLRLLVQTANAATAAGAATVTVTLESGDNPDLTGNTIVHQSFGPFSLAQMAASKRLVSATLPGGVYRRYMGVRYTVATGPLTGGTFIAGLAIGGEEAFYGGVYSSVA